jgi:glutathione S-transferase
MYRLVIGNKNYSSWSMRAWLAMRAAGIDFDEEVIPLDQPETAARIRARNPAGRVPVLIDDDFHIWESLAIVEYLAERHPDRAIWPAEPRARAMARVIASEMHAGFTHLRSAFHMNIRRGARPHPGGVTPEIAADISRICEIWSGARGEFQTRGPFLYGDFCAADAFFAPVVSRFHTYAVEVGPAERRYMDAVMSHQAFVEWADAARAEPWTIAREEVD